MRNLTFFPALFGSLAAVAVVLFVAFHFIFIDFLWIGGGMSRSNWSRIFGYVYFTNFFCPVV